MDLVHFIHLEPTHRTIHWTTVLSLLIAHLCAVDHVEPTLVGVFVRCHPSEDRRSIAVDKCPSVIVLVDRIQVHKVKRISQSKSNIV